MNFVSALPENSILRSNLALLFSRYPQLQQRVESFDLQGLNKFLVRRAESGIELLENGEVIDATWPGFFSPPREDDGSVRKIVVIEGFGLGAIYDWNQRFAKEFETDDF